jgi:hypothetical protein
MNAYEYHAWLVAKLRSQMEKDLATASDWETKGHSDYAGVCRRFAAEVNTALSYVENWNVESAKFARTQTATK